VWAEASSRREAIRKLSSDHNLRSTIVLLAGCAHIARTMAKNGQQKAKSEKPAPTAIHKNVRRNSRSDRL